MKTVTKIDKVQPLKTEKKILRVAAYCRVSTDSDAQLESLETQKKHMNLTLLLTGTGSLLGFILMKVLPEQKQKNVLD